MENEEKEYILTSDDDLVEIYEQVDEFVKFLENQIDTYKEKEN